MKRKREVDETMNGAFGFMDMLIIFSGAYLVYISVQMKRTGEINSAVVGKKVDMKKARDPKGYIEYMYLKSVVMGIIVMASGGLNYLNDNYWHIPYLGPVACGVFFVVIVIYGKITVDAQKKFLEPK